MSTIKGKSASDDAKRTEGIKQIMEREECTFEEATRRYDLLQQHLSRDVPTIALRHKGLRPLRGGEEN